MKKQILCLDFDGVCHSYTSGWQGADTIPDDPVPGLFEFLEAASKKFYVCIYSSRTHQSGGLNAMINWFLEHTTDLGPSFSGMAWHIGDVSDESWRDFEKKEARRTSFVLCFPVNKPPAKVSIDDRGLTFTGEWPEVEDLLNFTPWNK